MFLVYRALRRLGASRHVRECGPVPVRLHLKESPGNVGRVAGAGLGHAAGLEPR
jgi:hypothetical protein